MAASSATSQQLANMIAAASGKAGLDQLMENLQRHQQSQQNSQSQAQLAAAAGITGISGNSNGATSPSENINTSKDSLESSQNISEEKSKMASSSKQLSDLLNQVQAKSTPSQLGANSLTSSSLVSNPLSTNPLASLLETKTKNQDSGQNSGNNTNNTSQATSSTSQSPNNAAGGIDFSALQRQIANSSDPAAAATAFIAAAQQKMKDAKNDGRSSSPNGLPGPSMLNQSANDSLLQMRPSPPSSPSSTMMNHNQDGWTFEEQFKQVS